MEKIDQYKVSVNRFILNEFIVFLSQVAIFFMVAVFTSNFLKNKEGLIAFADQKIKDDAISQLGLTFFAILIVIGFFSTIGRVFDNKYVERVVTEVMLEMPKTIYVFGSASTGVLLAITVFLHLNPNPEGSAKRFAIVSIFFAVVIFFTGCFLSYLVKRKTHILSGNIKK